MVTSATTTPLHPTPYPAAALVDAVRPAIEADRAEAEELRRLPDRLRERLHAAGAFRLLTPRDLGGLELDLAEVVAVYEALGRIDGPVAWNVWNGNMGFAAALLEPAALEAIWGAPADPIIVNSARTTGRGRPVDGGFALSGRWDLVSAVDSADWAALFGLVMDGDAPRSAAPGVPDVHAFFVPRRDLTILDTWQVNAIRGTGSKTVVLDGVRVPEELAPSPFAPTRMDRPLYRIPAFTLASTGCAAVVSGMAQAALDAVVALAATKPTDNGAPLAERAHTQVALGAADASLSAARLLLASAAADLDASARAATGSSAGTESVISVAQRARLRAAMSHAAAVSREVLNTTYQLGSSSSLYVGQPLERLFHDGHAAAQHALLSPNHLGLGGCSLLGRAPDAPVF